MKNFLRIVLIALLVVSTGLAQTGTHNVTLNWTPSTDTGGTVNVYRALAACSTNPTFTQLKTGVAAAGPFIDTGVAVGNFCYRVTAVVGGAESAPSNTASATVLPQSPTNLVVTATQ